MLVCASTAAACGGDDDSGGKPSAPSSDDHDGGSSRGSGGASANQGSGMHAGSGGSAMHAGSGGSGSASEQDAGAGSDRDAGSAASATQVDACIEYLRAQCQRRFECGNYAVFEACFANVISCPDVLFSPGSTRTIAGTLACADEWRTASCADIERSIPPKCATPGTRVAGDGCVSGLQCASARCSGDFATCGVCLDIVGEGETCGDMIACEDGFTCDSETSTCTKFEPPPGLPDPKPLGAECMPNECGDNDCLAGDDGVSRCTPYPRLGESCEVPRTCAFDDVSYCDISLKCLKKPGDGQPCGVDGFTGMPGWCADDTRCDGDPPTCRALPKAGETCVDACAGDAMCECTDDACTARACHIVHLPGESCDSAKSETCWRGVSQCESGRCVAVDSQHLFEDLCK
jgi:hypothetical protein